MIKIEFPADRKDIAVAMGQALLTLGRGAFGSLPERVGDIEVETVTTTQPVTGGADLNPAAADDDADVGVVMGADSDTTAIGTSDGSVFPPGDPGTLPQVDHHGVAFNAAMCGVAAKPFYESGKTSGQWKKRKGVDQAAYDAWYAGELQPGAAQTTTDSAPLNTAGAFTGDGKATEAVHTHTPTTCGDFMGWASKKQAAGLLTQQDIADAYAAENLVITDLFPPIDEHTVAERVAVLYGRLTAKAGA